MLCLKVLTTDKMDVTLSTFIQEVRKRDKSEYPAKTLMELVCSLRKYLESNGVKVSLHADSRFSKLQTSLDVRMWEVTTKGFVLFPDQVQDVDI